MLLQNRKVAPRSCSPTSECCSPKHLCKAVAPKRLCFKPVPQSYSPKRLPKAAPQRCSRKLRFFNTAVQSCSSKLLPKAIPLRCATKLCPKLFSKAVAPKLRKAAPQSCCCPKLPAGLESCPKLLPKAATQSFSPALLPKVVPQSCCLKAAILHPKRLPKAILQSGFRKLRLKVATRSCCPKLLPQSYNLSNLYTKTAPQSYSAKRLPKAAPESCY